jgi:hypothetical protein
MSLRRWADPFTVHLHSAPWLPRLGAAVIALGAVALSFAGWLRWHRSTLGIGPSLVLVAGFIALMAGAASLRRHARRRHVVSVDAAGDLSLDGRAGQVLAHSWESGRLAGLVIRSDDGRTQTVLLAPGCAPALELQRLRTYMRWTLAQGPAIAIGDNTAGPGANVH